MSTIISAGTTTGSGFAVSPDTSGNLAFQTQAGANTITVPNTTGTVVVDTTQTMVLLSTQTASSSATIDFTSIANTTYNSYVLQIDNALPASNGVYLILRFSVGGTFQTTNYQSNVFRWTTSGSGVSGEAFGTGQAFNLNIGDSQANSANSPTGQGGATFSIIIPNCAQTATAKRVTWAGAYYGSTFIANTGAGGYIPATNAVDGFRLMYTSGNIATGTFKLYGIR